MVKRSTMKRRTIKRRTTKRRTTKRRTTKRRTIKRQLGGTHRYGGMWPFNRSGSADITAVKPDPDRDTRSYFNPMRYVTDPHARRDREDDRRLYNQNLPK